ncbi:MAG: DNA-directed RNA polymerase subunit beta [Acidobacteria bacterium]|nr:DNA-directed RNA polymerase subunit beta [Acidobacteriota bacterium]MBI3655191.1 DNA-directed RNA polymerase subunit beta [Acidobacteriota bacterium]
MRDVTTSNVYRSRIDYAKIRTVSPIPNLIEVQKKSYQRFLQMDLLPEEREDSGLQAVFNSVFPITDFRETASLEFVDYAIGNWECKCGNMKGLQHLRATCTHCKKTIIIDPYVSDDDLCKHCGFHLRVTVARCDLCGEPIGLGLKYSVDECQERGMTFAVPLKVTVRLVVWDKDTQTNVRKIRDIKEQEVYFGDIPLMTENGTFIVNGTERVIVSQLHRSPGVYFESNAARTYFLGKIIPYRGSWVEFEFDAKNILYVRIDRKKKFLASTFLRALGYKSNEQILRAFYEVVKLRTEGRQIFRPLAKNLIGSKLAKDIKDPKHGKEVLTPRGRKISHSVYEQLVKAGVTEIEIDPDDLQGAYAIADIIERTTGEPIVEMNEAVDAAALNAIIASGLKEFEVFFPEADDTGVVITQTVAKDGAPKDDPETAYEDALFEIYRKQRPGDMPTRETAQALFEGMFFDPRKYDFSRVGRLKFNIKTGLNTSLEQRTLSVDDITAVIKYVLKLRKNIGTVDDIDHLGNRRVRAVGELLENQFRVGLVRMERAIKEKMSVHQEMATAMPHDLINPKPVMAAIKEFFGSSQLSQFMDQTNPLSEITHKRRVSALGPGGLSRERAGFEVRDVHPTHYGRICPIETPEGPNIGLISSLSCYARINDYGFIESPYRKVEEGSLVDYVTVINAGDTHLKAYAQVAKDQFERENKKILAAEKKPATAEPFSFYLTAWEEDRYVIAQANVEVDKDGFIIPERVTARHEGNFILAQRDQVQYIDVSPKQLVSVAASLIPFLEHDDANRALMGSNMQRQAVPLLRAEAPYVGTGMEHIVAKDSGAVAVCRRAGVVDSVDSQRIILRAEGANRSSGRGDEAAVDIYNLVKFRRSNQNTCVNQKPLVRQGDYVAKGQVLADGPCTDKGELALGRNVLAAFMPWRGYNFEDAILISERVVKEDAYTSIHIEELEIEARDTKLGPEEITRDIPNVSEGLLKDLDESGIIRIGAKVKPGDYLVGKVTPKGETQLSPEEKLLRAIFGEKAEEVRDASLICPPGIEGTIVDVKIFSRKGVPKDERAKSIEREHAEKLSKDLKDEIRIIKEEKAKRLIDVLSGESIPANLTDKSGDAVIKKGAKLTKSMLKELSNSDVNKIKALFKDGSIHDECEHLDERMEKQVSVLERLFEDKIQRLKRGDELPPGVIKMVKVYVAMKRKLSVGDKMAGRHGNKGVVAKILPDEDMPYLPDGTPVEIVLNPLGVPSRMNIGQILETHLGWAAKALGLFFATPVFDGASEGEIKEMLKKANLPSTGKTTLYDGMTGERFDQKVTVGNIYLLKLGHLVDDKIHARSIGPYSLITQQPLGGKAQFGGQRFGEMEVWALEAYGAANILQELLTAKSDDVQGRTKIYEAIVKGEPTFKPGIPESFNVLIRELQSLCLDVELLQKAKPAPAEPTEQYTE